MDRPVLNSWEFPGGKSPSVDGLGDRGEHLSIMIPNYNGAKLIGETLRALLDQRDTIANAQIMVLDNCSTDDSEEVVTRIMGDRAAFHRHHTNLGGAANFNACVEMAERRWVHILHSDDVPLDTGYVEFDRCIRTFPEVHIIFGRTVTIDESGNWLSLSELLGEKARGVLPYSPATWRRNIAQFVGTIFQRDTGMAAGRFDEDIAFTSDWYFWWLIASQYPAAYTNHTVGQYRVHPSSGTNVLRKSGTDIQHGIETVRRIVESPSSDRWRKEAGNDFLYRYIYQHYRNQLVQSIGDREQFDIIFKNMEGFPTSLFTASEKRRILRWKRLRNPIFSTFNKAIRRMLWILFGT